MGDTFDKVQEKGLESSRAQKGKELLELQMQMPQRMKNDPKLFAQWLHAVVKRSDGDGGDDDGDEWSGRVKAIRQALRQDVEKVMTKVGGVEAKVGGVEAKVGGMEAKVAGGQAKVEAKVGAVEAKVGAVEAKIDEVMAAVQALLPKQEGMAGKEGEGSIALEVYGRKAANVEAKLAEMMAGVEAKMESKVDILGKKVDDSAAHINELMAMMKNLEAKPQASVAADAASGSGVSAPRRDQSPRGSGRFQLTKPR